MKLKKFIILIPLIVFLSGCSKKHDFSLNENLKQKYDFYEDSVTKIINKMDVSVEQADDIFLILIDLGLDNKISSIFESNDSYALYVGNKYLYIYLLEGSVDKITDLYKNIVYPASMPLATTSIEETEINSIEIKESIEISGHYFRYKDRETQLIITFNRPLSDDELGNPLSPNYTYKYYLTTESGEDFIVDYNNGTALSNVYFNDDYTEYKIADSGNGMRDGKYSSNSDFNENNIISIKIQLYKKINDDRYSHEYEIINEYNYSTNEENLETIN